MRQSVALTEVREALKSLIINDNCIPFFPPSLPFSLTKSLPPPVPHHELNASSRVNVDLQEGVSLLVLQSIRHTLLNPEGGGERGGGEVERG